MATSSDLPEQRSALQQRLQCAEGLVQKAEQIRMHGKIQGMQKMVKQIKSEMAMLQKV